MLTFLHCGVFFNLIHDLMSDDVPVSSVSSTYKIYCHISVTCWSKYPVKWFCYDKSMLTCMFVIRWDSAPQKKKKFNNNNKKKKKIKRGKKKDETKNSFPGIIFIIESDCTFCWSQDRYALLLVAAEVHCMFWLNILMPSDQATNIFLDNHMHNWCLQTKPQIYCLTTNA